MTDRGELVRRLKLPRIIICPEHVEHMNAERRQAADAIELLESEVAEWAKVFSEVIILRAQVHSLEKRQDELRRENAALEGALRNSGNMVRSLNDASLKRQRNFMKNCLIKCRDGKPPCVWIDDEYVFTLDNYALIPREQYDQVIRAGDEQGN